VAPTTYSVTYDGNTNGSGAAPTDSTAYSNGANVIVAGNTGTLAKTGYTFDGWCTTQPAAGAACTGTPRAVASTFSIVIDTTLYAVWVLNTQTISYAAGGGSGSAPSSPTTVSYGGTFTTPANTYTRTGYTFAGWSDGSSTYAAAATYPASGTVTGNVTLTATWTASCASGGTCAVGDTGPGGGIVFYVDSSTFACGAALESTCKYLEAAPTSGTNAWTESNYVWSGNTTAAIGASAQGTAIGTGYRNTQAMVAQSSTASRAGTISRAYRGPNNLADWYLPSKDELNELYTRRSTVGASEAGGFWSSSEDGASTAWVHYFNTGSQVSGTKTSSARVRPIRAFGLPPFSVTYNGNTNGSGAVPTDSSTYAFNASVTVASNTGSLAKSGYTFGGWCTTQPAAGSACGGTSRAAGSTFSITSNVTLYAVWTPSCASGGTCVVGDTGPGGGIVFYVAGSNFTSTGSDCNTTCRYLEAAPADVGTTHTWCSNTSTALGVRATGIGNGMANTTTADTTCTSGAIQEAANYTNNSKSDWHLPSKDELNELCKYARNTGQAAGGAVLCVGGSLRTGFATWRYWSSSESELATIAWYQFFDSGNQTDNGKTFVSNVRPVRAF
jgi:uncharacterized repeat protein (TIGR02543 family)